MKAYDAMKQAGSTSWNSFSTAGSLTTRRSWLGTMESFGPSLRSRERSDFSCSASSWIPATLSLMNISNSSYVLGWR